MESKLLRFQQDVIEGEILNLIKKEALPILERLLEWSQSHEARALYLKMKADCKRYLAEMLPSDSSKHQETLDDAQLYYEHARGECEYLMSTHSLRLSCALNHAVLLAETNKSVA